MTTKRHRAGQAVRLRQRRTQRFENGRPRTPEQDEQWDELLEQAHRDSRR